MILVTTKIQDLHPFNLFSEEELKGLPRPTKGPEIGLFIHGGDGPPSFEFEWLEGDESYREIVLRLANREVNHSVGMFADNTWYPEISQAVHYVWTDFVRGLWPELDAVPRLYIKLTHGASHARRVPAPYTAAYAKSLQHLSPRKLRRRRMQDIQKVKHERWLLLDAKYHKKGPKKPHPHHTSKMGPFPSKFGGKASPLTLEPKL